MLDDPLLRDARGRARARRSAVNAEWALRTVSESLHALFSQFTRRLPARAQHRPRRRDRPRPAEPARLARTRRRSPGCRARWCWWPATSPPRRRRELDWDRVLAIVTDVGSSTYHTAIIARSLGIPAVAGLKDATRQIPPGSLVVVDGTRGEVVVEPSGSALDGFRAAQERVPARGGAAAGHARAAGADARTAWRCALEANVEFPEEAATAQQYGAAGHRALPLRVPARPRPALADRGAAARRLPPPARADAPVPGHGAHLGRGPRGARARPARRARTRRSASARCGCCERARSRSGCSCARCCARGLTGPCASCSPS